MCYYYREGLAVGVVYYRAGYTSNDYPTEQVQYEYEDYEPYLVLLNEYEYTLPSSVGLPEC